jgi:hypothetical protein
LGLLAKNRLIARVAMVEGKRENGSEKMCSV